MQKGKYYRMMERTGMGSGHPGSHASFFHSFWENERYGRYVATGGVHFYGV